MTAPEPFAHVELLPLGADTTNYRLISREGVTVAKTELGEFLRVDAGAITRLVAEAMRDIAHFLRPEHLQQLANIFTDPEASENDRFVALDLLKNASIAAGGVLPMCQDTGTAIIKAKKVSSCSPAAPTTQPSRGASMTPTSPATCDTANWPRFRCTKKSTPAPICRPR